MVTSAGTASAVSIIKALRLKFKHMIVLVAADCDPMAPGLHLADEAVISQRFTEEGYLTWLKATIKAHGIKVIIPTYSKEIYYLTQHIDALHAETGVTAMLHIPQTYHICDNKFVFADFCAQHNLKVPKTWRIEAALAEAEAGTITYPLFVKPATGSGSNDVARVNSKEDLVFWAHKYTEKGNRDNMLVQQFIEGQEFTVDGFADRQHRAMVVSPRQRMSVKAGQMVKGVTVDAAPFQASIERLCQLLPLSGVFNAQYMYDGSDYYLIEVNPRFAAGGLMLTVNAGGNIPELYVRGALGQDLEPQPIKPNIYMIRYWEEIFTDKLPV